MGAVAPETNERTNKITTENANVSSRITSCTPIYFLNLISVTEGCDEKRGKVLPFYTSKAYGGVEIELSPSEPRG